MVNPFFIRNYTTFLFHNIFFFGIKVLHTSNILPKNQNKELIITLLENNGMQHSAELQRLEVNEKMATYAQRSGLFLLHYTVKADGIGVFRLEKCLNIRFSENNQGLKFRNSDQLTLEVFRKL
jgi:hypothetical protein